MLIRNSMRKTLAVLLASICAAADAAAQMSISTIGATDARACYKNATDEFSEDLLNCNDALDDRALSRVDRKKTLVNRGIILNRRGDYNEALADFNAAIDIDSKLAEAYLNRGNTWFYAGRLDDALADYEKSLELDVAKPWAAWYNIGLARDAQKKPAEAQVAYRKALDLNPDFYLAQQKVSD